MSTYTQIYYHLVYSTKGRIPALFEDRREKLFHYHWGVLKNNQCVLYRINAVDDHMHMLMSLHPTIALSNLIRDMKAASTTWMRGEMGFHDFPGWQVGYGAFTKSYAEKEAVIQYIRDQQEHHKTISFREELKQLLEEAGIAFDEKYLD
jgi:REP element-mobilizing transposase RayT